jgi:predicted enzyme related to lactoylglutathione lyase
MKLGAARIFVHDIAEARTFYEKHLGLDVEIYDAENGFCMFDTGSTKLILETVAPNASDEAEELVGRFTGLSFPVDDIVAAHRLLSSSGIQFSGAPEQQYWGGWLATFTDPSGNGLQLVQQSA